MVVKPFQDLTTQELYAVLQLRSEVFVAEQECAYQDVDGLDTQAHHVFITEDESVLAYCRILPSGVVYEDWAIGRVVVAKEARGKSLARKLMQSAVEYIQAQEVGSVTLSAQLYLQAFYESLGFVAQGGPYPEDGIPHIKMRLVF